MESKSKLFFIAVKLILFFVIIYYGFFVAAASYETALKPLPPETQPPFQAELKPQYGPKWGDISITMQPQNAFIVGDRISTNLTIRLWGISEDTATIMIVFPESISVLKEWEWANYSHYEELIVLYGNFTYEPISQDLTLWYLHEGIFGINVTVVQFGVINQMQEFRFPDIVHIKSYSFLEERRNAQLTMALNERIFGLTIVAVSPIAVQVVDLFEQAFRNLRFRRKRVGSQVNHNLFE